MCKPAIRAEHERERESRKKKRNKHLNWFVLRVWLSKLWLKIAKSFLNDTQTHTIPHCHLFQNHLYITVWCAQIVFVLPLPVFSCVKYLHGFTASALDLNFGIFFFLTLCFFFYFIYISFAVIPIGYKNFWTFLYEGNFMIKKKIYIINYLQAYSKMELELELELAKTMPSIF